jgi:glycosyltransferase involved in cell wall biosynthesis
MINVLHITNTDFLDDSRIQKEVDSISFFSHLNISIIGMRQHHKNLKNSNSHFKYFPLDLFFNKLLFLPKIIIFPFLMIEFLLVSVYLSLKIRPNVIHCHDAFCLPISWFISSIFGCKLIYDAHELESNKNGQNILFSSISFLIEKLFWYRINGFITVSHSILDWYFRKFSYKNNCIIVNSPKTNNSGALLSSNYFRDKYNLNDSDIIFCYLGLFSKGRGIEMLLNYFSKTSYNFHIIFVGKGVLENKIVEYSKKHPNIHIHSPVNHDEVVNLITSADWGLCLLENVSLSDYYSLPNKVFEYAFSNIKIISSNFPEIDSFVKSNDLGFTCNPDIISFSNIMELIYKNDFHFEKNDIFKYSWEYQSIKLNEFYLNFI